MLRGLTSIACRNRSIVESLTRRKSSSAVVPANLHLADASAILAPPPSNKMQTGASTSSSSSSSMDYLFPPLNVPKSIKVKVFQKPGTFVEESTSSDNDAKQNNIIAEVPIERLIFGVAIRKDIVHEVIRYQRHKARQPKKTKRIGEIAGSTKKPRPQKGTGSAQVGHRRNSAWRGGQKAHGPVIRDYSISMNRKMRAMGMMIALTAKYREGNLFVFDSLSCGSSKTKDLSALLAQHGIADSHDSNSLIVDDDFKESFVLACRNLAHATLMPQTQANVYDIVKREKLILSASAFVALQSRILEQYLYNGKRKHFFVQKTLMDANMLQELLK